MLMLHKLMLALFIDAPLPTTSDLLPKRARYVQKYESYHKDVKRAFGVFQTWFTIIGEAT